MRNKRFLSVQALVNILIHIEKINNLDMTLILSSQVVVKAQGARLKEIKH